MNKEIKSTLKKTAKIAGVTCLAAGAVAIVTSTAALKAIGEGSKYLVNTVKNILKEEPQAEEISEVTGEDCAAAECEAAAEEIIAEESPAEQETI